MDVKFNIDGEKCEHKDCVAVLISVVKKHKSGINYGVHTTVAGNYVDLCRAFTSLGAAIQDGFTKQNKDAIDAMHEDLKK